MAAVATARILHSGTVGPRPPEGQADDVHAFALEDLIETALKLRH